MARCLGGQRSYTTLMRRKLRSYLRARRKGSGLTQDEVAFLLSGRAGSNVSRYEHGDRRPNILTAFGYQVTFGVSAHELLDGLFAEVEQNVMKRADQLLRRLGREKESPRQKRKLLFLHKLTSRR